MPTQVLATSMSVSIDFAMPKSPEDDSHESMTLIRIQGDSIFT